MRESLNVSIFYPREGWHRLLNECLGPLLAHGKQERWLLTYGIFLGSIRGDNIHVTLWFERGNRSVWAPFFDSYVREFLEASPSVGRTKNCVPEPLFMDFPENSVAYGLKEGPLEKESFSWADQWMIHEATSEAMMSAFGEEEVDDSGVFTFCVLLSLSLCNLWKEGGLNIRQVLEKELASVVVFAENPLPIEAAAVKLYRENKESLDRMSYYPAEWIERWTKAIMPVKDPLLQIPEGTILLFILEHAGLQLSVEVLSFFHLLHNIHIDGKRGPMPRQSIDVTAILTIWKRDHLEEQIQALLEQSTPPKEILVYHCGSFVKDHPDSLRRYPQIRYQHNAFDLGYFGRFSLGLSAKSPLLYVLDDDVIPSRDWLKRCTELVYEKNAIVSSSGRIIPDQNYMPEFVRGRRDLTEYFKGDAVPESRANLCEEDTIVDFGCNSWILRTEWLAHFWSFRPVTMDMGEDIHLSASCSLRAGIPTLCPRQEETGVSGNVKKAYGFDHQASWKRPGFLSRRERVLRQWIDENGWKPQRWK